MALDPIRLPVLAAKKEDENWRFRDFIKRHCDIPEEEIDAQVFAVTKQVWAGIDCTQCANCCKTVPPTLSETDVDRLARRLAVPRQTVIDSYLEKTEPNCDEPWITRSTPCPFLKDNQCSVYEDRPDDCRGYPYLYEPEFASRTIGMLERTFTCPIVYEVIEELKESTGFHRRRSGRKH